MSKKNSKSSISLTNFVSFDDVMSNSTSFSRDQPSKTQNFPFVSNELSIVYNGSDSDLALASKKLLKKSPTTKLKAFSEIEIILNERGSSVIYDFVPHFSFLFLRLYLDNDKQIRFQLFSTLSMLLRIDRNPFSNYIKHLIGPWWISMSDPKPEVAQAALDSYQVVFPGPKKRSQMTFYLSPLILHHIRKNMDSRVETLSDLSQCSQEEAEERFERVMVSSLVSLSGLQASLSSEENSQLVRGMTPSDTDPTFSALWREHREQRGEEDTPLVIGYGEVLGDSLWKKLSSKRPPIRAALHSLLAQSLVLPPPILACPSPSPSQLSPPRLASSICLLLSEDHFPALSPALEAFLAFVLARPSFWEWESAGLTRALPALSALLDKHPDLFLRYLVPILGSVPAALLALPAPSPDQPSPPPPLASSFLSLLMSLSSALESPSFPPSLLTEGDECLLEGCVLLLLRRAPPLTPTSSPIPPPLLSEKKKEKAREERGVGTVVSLSSEELRAGLIRLLSSRVILLLSPHPPSQPTLSERTSEKKVRGREEKKGSREGSLDCLVRVLVQVNRASLLSLSLPSEAWQSQFWVPLWAELRRVAEEGALGLVRAVVSALEREGEDEPPSSCPLLSAFLPTHSFLSHLISTLCSVLFSPSSDLALQADCGVYWLLSSLLSLSSSLAQSGLEEALAKSQDLSQLSLNLPVPRPSSLPQTSPALSSLFFSLLASETKRTIWTSTLLHPSLSLLPPSLHSSIPPFPIQSLPPLLSLVSLSSSLSIPPLPHSPSTLSSLLAHIFISISSSPLVSLPTSPSPCSTLLSLSSLCLSSRSLPSLNLLLQSPLALSSLPLHPCGEESPSPSPSPSPFLSLSSLLSGLAHNILSHLTPPSPPSPSLPSPSPSSCSSIDPLISDETLSQAISLAPPPSLFHTLSLCCLLCPLSPSSPHSRLLTLSSSPSPHRDLVWTLLSFLSSSLSLPPHRSSPFSSPSDLWVWFDEGGGSSLLSLLFLHRTRDPRRHSHSTPPFPTSPLFPSFSSHLKSIQSWDSTRPLLLSAPPSFLSSFLSKTCDLLSPSLSPPLPSSSSSSSSSSSLLEPPKFSRHLRGLISIERGGGEGKGDEERVLFRLGFSSPSHLRSLSLALLSPSLPSPSLLSQVSFLIEVMLEMEEGWEEGGGRWINLPTYPSLCLHLLLLLFSLDHCPFLSSSSEGRFEGWGLLKSSSLLRGRVEGWVRDSSSSTKLNLLSGVRGEMERCQWAGEGGEGAGFGMGVGWEVGRLVVASILRGCLSCPSSPSDSESSPSPFPSPLPFPDQSLYLPSPESSPYFPLSLPFLSPSTSQPLPRVGSRVWVLRQRSKEEGRREVWAEECRVEGVHRYSPLEEPYFSLSSLSPSDRREFQTEMNRLFSAPPSPSPSPLCSPSDLILEDIKIEEEGKDEREGEEEEREDSLTLIVQWTMSMIASLDPSNPSSLILPVLLSSALCSLPTPLLPSHPLLSLLIPRCRSLCLSLLSLPNPSLSSLSLAFSLLHSLSSSPLALGQGLWLAPLPSLLSPLLSFLQSLPVSSSSLSHLLPLILHSLSSLLSRIQWPVLAHHPCMPTLLSLSSSITTSNSSSSLPLSLAHLSLLAALWSQPPSSTSPPSLSDPSPSPSPRPSSPSPSSPSPPTSLFASYLAAQDMADEKEEEEEGGLQGVEGVGEEGEGVVGEDMELNVEKGQWEGEEGEYDSDHIRGYTSLGIALRHLLLSPSPFSLSPSSQVSLDLLPRLSALGLHWLLRRREEGLANRLRRAWTNINVSPPSQSLETSLLSLLLSPPSLSPHWAVRLVLAQTLDLLYSEEEEGEEEGVEEGKGVVGEEGCSVLGREGERLVREIEARLIVGEGKGRGKDRSSSSSSTRGEEDEDSPLSQNRDGDGGDELGVSLLSLLLLQRVDSMGGREGRRGREGRGKRGECGSYLMNSGLLSRLLPRLLRSVPGPSLLSHRDLPHTLSRTLPVPPSFSTPSLLTPSPTSLSFLALRSGSDPSLPREELAPLLLTHRKICVYTLYRLVVTLPASVRQWWSSDQCPRLLRSSLSSFVEERVRRHLVAREVEWIERGRKLGAHGWEDGEFSLVGRVGSGEVEATYMRDDGETRVTMIITLPPSYPLKNVEVECTSWLGVGEGRWRRWVLQIVRMLSSQDGRVVDAALLWKGNMEKELEGAEPCPVCYSTLHPKTLSLPEMTCPTCHNRFHSPCLQTWFKSSGKSQCVVCQQPFFQ